MMPSESTAVPGPDAPLPASPPASRQRPVAHFLRILVLACLLPGVIGIAFFIALEYREERSRQTEDTIKMAQSIMVHTDAHLLRTRDLARALAEVGDGLPGQLAAFRRQAAHLMSAAAAGGAAALYQADGSLFASLTGSGDPLAKTSAHAAAVAQVFATGQPFLSNVLAGAGAAGPVLAVYVPVTGGGKTTYALAIAIPASQLSAQLSDHKLPDGWLASLLDRQGVIMGRNRNAASLVGKPARATLREEVVRQSVGTVEHLTQDGMRNFTVFVRSPETGYTSIVGIPRQQILMPLLQKLAFLGILVTLLFAAGLLLARRMGSSIARSFHVLIEQAYALGHGGAQARKPLHVLEAVQLGGAMEQAAELLRQRDADLRAQQDELQQFKFFSEHSNEMLLLLDERGAIRYANRMACERLGYRNDELLAMTLFDLDLPTAPELLRSVFDICRHSPHPPPPFERVYRCKNGSEFPVEISATVLQHRGEWLMHVAPRDISERRQAEQAVRWAATHDALTGLANRTQALAFLESALARGPGWETGGSLLFIDLDRFKPVNDIHGHDVGDRVLREIAARLQACTAGRGLLARAGGDEFMLIMGDGNVRDPVRMADTIIRAVAAPVSLGNIEVALSASVGISLFPQHGETASALIHAADMAMLAAKQSGRAGARLYSHEMGEQAQFTLSVQHRLQQAIDHDGLRLHYQPIVNLATGLMDGAEALVRLEDGLAPQVGPATFIPIAESCGLIAPLGAWAAQEACRQQVAWEAAGMALTVSINVSAIQFRRAGFAAFIRELIASSGMNPRRLVLELTETAIMENLAESVAVLHEIRALGVKIALDDFGTGYSSLSSLSTLPLDKLKIDQSFVRRLETDHASRAVIDAVIALARSLDLELVAEGIETAAALHYLRERGCQSGQGYHFSRPLPAPGLEAWYGRQCA